jgi:hypothetical protein
MQVIFHPLRMALSGTSSSCVSLPLLFMSWSGQRSEEV